MHFGLRDVAEGERQMVQERDPVHTRSLPHTNGPHLSRSRKADRADSREPAELGWNLPGPLRFRLGALAATGQDAGPPGRVIKSRRFIR
jgi:hypothetical protein